MTINSAQIRTGMKVFDTDGIPAGEVAEVRDSDFLLRGKLEPPVYVPFTAIRDIRENRINLDIRADDFVTPETPTTDLTAPFTRQQIRRGMEVVASDGGRIGRVIAIDDTYILVERQRPPNLRVPLDVIGEIAGNRIAIEIPAGQVDNMDWPAF